jgi:hypothetical protein
MHANSIAEKIARIEVKMQIHLRWGQLPSAGPRQKKGAGSGL